MPGQNDLHTHFSRALHDCIEVLYLEPQQHTVPVWLVIAIGDQAVMVFHLEAMQLKHELPV
jgi:hypothetical protein